MDLFDERILTELNDGRPRVFTQLLEEVGFGRNTLRLHLKRLIAQSLVVKEKTVSNGRGRPKYAYFISSRVRQQVSAALSDPSITIVTLPFSRIRHLCRFEKGGYCKQVRNKCDAANCPQIPKNKELKPFLTILGTHMRAMGLFRRSACIRRSSLSRQLSRRRLCRSSDGMCDLAGWVLLRMCHRP